MLDEMCQQSASKSTLFLAYENPGMIFKLHMGFHTPKIMVNVEAFR